MPRPFYCGGIKIKWSMNKRCTGLYPKVKAKNMQENALRTFTTMNGWKCAFCASKTWNIAPPQQKWLQPNNRKTSNDAGIMTLYLNSSYADSIFLLVPLTLSPWCTILLRFFVVHNPSWSSAPVIFSIVFLWIGDWSMLITKQSSVLLI